MGLFSWEEEIFLKLFFAYIIELWHSEHGVILFLNFISHVLNNPHLVGGRSPASPLQELEQGGCRPPKFLLHFTVVVLHSKALYCNSLYCTVLYCTVL